MDLKLSEVHGRMIKAIDIIKNDLSSIRSGRATPSLIENIIVSTYDGSQKLRIMELGTISTSDPRTLVIQSWDQTTASDIAKAILETNIGLNPSVDGAVIRISFPPLTEERRKEFVKLLKQKIEAGKVMIRQIRHDKMSEFKRMFENDEISEDDKKRFEEDLQKLTDKNIAVIEEIGIKKEEELLQI